ncbi:hypothetical protein H9L05_15755 [Hymenobacter qilianensis]|uniref:Uncharacterized protein n=1 Tax=Hymenobacter qilianensis TaxID=1385715 RepID=A0A7H0GT48_9BACT|nr:hypothetical protein [Hymenobacter qilianensis]QNP51464.1 hypothetical protein H9L05_15755 [Hymenobacter qilianensis]
MPKDTRTKPKETRTKQTSAHLLVTGYFYKPTNVPSTTDATDYYLLAGPGGRRILPWQPCSMTRPALGFGLL